MAVSPTVLLSLVIVLALVHGAFSGGTYTYHCNPGFVQSSADETKCFRAVRSARKTWNDAKAACTARSGTLASGVRLREDILGVTRRLRFQAHFWIGVSNSGNGWKYLDGAPVSSPPFKHGRGNRHNCVTVKKGSPKWFDKNCNKRRFFVCQYDAVETYVGP